MSTKNNATLTKAVLHLRESIDAEWLQNIAIEGKAGRTGATGPQGLKGKDGKTYTPILREVDGEVFVDFYTDERTVVGTINIKGANGVDGVNGIDGVDGKTYTPVLREEDGKVYLDFVEGDTTISGALNLKGEQGAKGDTGANGKSAYAIAVENGYEGTEEEYTELVTSVPENAQKAEDAKEGAEQARDEAVVALNNGCVYKVVDLGVASIIPVVREKTIYKFSVNGSCAIAFDLPTLDNEAIVFWLWIAMGDTAYTLTFPPNITWINEPSLGANTQCMLALMSVDQGATWIANTQWEKQGGVLV